MILRLLQDAPIPKSPKFIPKKWIHGSANHSPRPLNTHHLTLFHGLGIETIESLLLMEEILHPLLSKKTLWKIGYSAYQLVGRISEPSTVSLSPAPRNNPLLQVIVFNVAIDVFFKDLQQDQKKLYSQSWQPQTWVFSMKSYGFSVTFPEANNCNMENCLLMKTSNRFPGLLKIRDRLGQEVYSLTSSRLFSKHHVEDVHDQNTSGRGYFITNPNNAFWKGKSPKITIHLQCLIPPKWVI